MVVDLHLDRWALYPPGKVPLGVTVHVNEEDGDVSIETPSSLQVFIAAIIDMNFLCSCGI